MVRPHPSGVFQTISGQPAQLTTPAPGTTLTSDTMSFNWTGGLGVTQYWLKVRFNGGAAPTWQMSTAGTSLATTVTTLPTDGRPLFVRLQSLINGAWQFNDYTLTAARLFTIQKAELVSPAPQSTLAASTVAFEWTGGSGATGYRLVHRYRAWHNRSLRYRRRDRLSIVVSGLPNDGRTLYVRLWSQ
jgi:hypothetical protein